jgi:hypothetical protein
VTRGQVHPDRTSLAFFLIILFQEPPDLMRLHADDGILLRIEIDTALVDFQANQVLVQLVAVSLECLLANEVEKTSLLWGV